jgi:hypothetical protein
MAANAKTSEDIKRERLDVGNIGVSINVQPFAVSANETLEDFEQFDETIKKYPDISYITLNYIIKTIITTVASEIYNYEKLLIIADRFEKYMSLILQRQKDDDISIQDGILYSYVTSLDKEHTLNVTINDFYESCKIKLRTMNKTDSALKNQFFDEVVNFYNVHELFISDASVINTESLIRNLVSFIQFSNISVLNTFIQHLLSKRISETSIINTWIKPVASKNGITLAYKQSVVGTDVIVNTSIIDIMSELNEKLASVGGNLFYKHSFLSFSMLPTNIQNLIWHGMISQYVENVISKQLTFERVLHETLRDLYFLQTGLIGLTDLNNIDKKTISELEKETSEIDYSVITLPKKRILIDNLNKKIKYFKYQIYILQQLQDNYEAQKLFLFEKNGYVTNENLNLLFKRKIYTKKTDEEIEKDKLRSVRLSEPAAKPKKTKKSKFGRRKQDEDEDVDIEAKPEADNEAKLEADIEKKDEPKIIDTRMKDVKLEQELSFSGNREVIEAKRDLLKRYTFENIKMTKLQRNMLFRVNEKIFIQIIPYLPKSIIDFFIKENILDKQTLLPDVQEYIKREIEQYEKNFQIQMEKNEQAEASGETINLSMFDDESIKHANTIAAHQKYRLQTLRENEEELAGKGIDINSYSYLVSKMSNTFSVFDDSDNRIETRNRLLELRTLTYKLSVLSDFIMKKYIDIVGVTMSLYDKVRSVNMYAYKNKEDNGLNVFKKLRGVRALRNENEPSYSTNNLNEHTYGIPDTIKNKILFLKSLMDFYTKTNAVNRVNMYKLKYYILIEFVKSIGEMKAMIRSRNSNETDRTESMRVLHTYTNRFIQLLQIDSKIIKGKKTAIYDVYKRIQGDRFKKRMNQFVESVIPESKEVKRKDVSDALTAINKIINDKFILTDKKLVDKLEKVERSLHPSNGGDAEVFAVFTANKMIICEYLKDVQTQKQVIRDEIDEQKQAEAGAGISVEKEQDESERDVEILPQEEYYLGIMNEKFGVLIYGKK